MTAQIITLPVAPRRCSTRAAVMITGICARTLQEKAACGLIPGAAKLFGRWTFDVAALERLVEQGSQPCRKASTRAATGGGRVSRSPASPIESRYESLFAGRRKNG